VLFVFKKKRSGKNGRKSSRQWNWLKGLRYEYGCLLGFVRMVERSHDDACESTATRRTFRPAFTIENVEQTVRGAQTARLGLAL
jgi:hypothetical protein